ncbi:MAG: type II toxin-antitoxin system PemK/MazF family toxin [Acidimicrobiales bacterium]
MRRGGSGGSISVIRSPEADKRRPGVIVSNDGANAAASRLGRGVVTVVPVVERRADPPFQVLLTAEATGLARDSKAQANR